MAQATVLGSGSTTVTIPVTSQDNANAMQAALNAISSGVLASTLTQVNYVGGSTLPAVSTPQGGVVEQGTSTVPLAPFQLGNGYVSAVLNGVAAQTVITGIGSNQTIASGTKGATVGNLGTNTQVFFGGGNNAFVEFAATTLGLNPSAVIGLDGNGNFDLSGGSTTVNASNGTVLNLINNVNGQNIVNFAAGASTTASNVIEFSGSALTADTVNAAGAPLAVFQNGGAGVINAGSSNVSIFGNVGLSGLSGTGSVTLFGGTGTDVVNQGTGFFQAGSGGNSLMVGSTLGPSTLIGGGAGDTVIGFGAKSLLVAGPGAETLAGGSNPIIAIGNTNPSSAVLIMLGGQTGGNTFFTGFGITAITGNHGGSGGNTYSEFKGGPGTIINIGDFKSGVDVLSSSKPGGGTYQLEIGAPPTANQMSFDYTLSGNPSAPFNTTVKFGDGTTLTMFGTVLQVSDIH
jgi:hypothetical protein